MPLPLLSMTTVAALSIGAVPLGAHQAPATVGVSGTILMRLVQQQRHPEYPTPSLQSGTEGIVVVEVVVSDSGSVDTITLMEAPDQPTADAVGTALRQWRFAPLTYQGRPARMRAKLFFYFVTLDGEGKVFTWHEMAKFRHPLRSFESRASPSEYRTVSLDRWNTDHRGSGVLLDARRRDAFARGHVEGAYNIPEDELFERGPAELPFESVVGIDCPAGFSEHCAHVASTLSRTGFTNVVIVDRPRHVLPE
jgi:TonB family protein